MDEEFANSWMIHDDIIDEWHYWYKKNEEKIMGEYYTDYEKLQNAIKELKFALEIKSNKNDELSRKNYELLEENKKLAAEAAKLAHENVRIVREDAFMSQEKKIITQNRNALYMENKRLEKDNAALIKSRDEWYEKGKKHEQENRELHERLEHSDDKIRSLMNGRTQQRTASAENEIAELKRDNTTLKHGLCLQQVHASLAAHGELNLLKHKIQESQDEIEKRESHIRQQRDGFSDFLGAIHHRLRTGYVDKACELIHDWRTGVHNCRGTNTYITPKITDEERESMKLHANVQEEIKQLAAKLDATNATLTKRINCLDRRITEEEIFTSRLRGGVEKIESHQERLQKYVDEKVRRNYSLQDAEIRKAFNDVQQDMTEIQKTIKGLTSNPLSLPEGRLKKVETCLRNFDTIVDQIKKELSKVKYDVDQRKQYGF